jgi:hypothetical protein
METAQSIRDQLSNKAVTEDSISNDPATAPNQALALSAEMPQLPAPQLPNPEVHLPGDEPSKQEMVS